MSKINLQYENNNVDVAKIFGYSPLPTPRHVSVEKTIINISIVLTKIDFT